MIIRKRCLRRIRGLIRVGGHAAAVQGRFGGVVNFKSRYEPVGGTPSSSSSLSCRSSSILLPSSSSSLPSSSERYGYPAVRTATATGPERSRASLATRYHALTMRISSHHFIMSSYERELKLHACWVRRPMRSDPVLVDPAPSLRPSIWNL
jgi:hypothetical protein